MIEEEKQVNEEHVADAAMDSASNGVDVVEEMVADSDLAEEEPDTEPPLEDQLIAAEALAQEYLDGWQRARAEFANARKRMQRESAETYRNATVDMISRLLPVLDDCDRALGNVPETIAGDKWFEGIQLVHRKLQSILEGAEIEAIPAVGEEFDPNVHNAIMKENSEEYESGKVIRELQTGYKLGDRIIRPTLVVVAE